MAYIPPYTPADARLIRAGSFPLNLPTGPTVNPLGSLFTGPAGVPLPQAGPGGIISGGNALGNPFASTAVGAASPVTPSSIPMGAGGPMWSMQGAPQPTDAARLFTAGSGGTTVGGTPMNPFSYANPQGPAPTSQFVRNTVAGSSRPAAWALNSGTKPAMAVRTLGRGLAGMGITYGLNQAGDLAGDNATGDAFRASALPAGATYSAAAMVPGAAAGPAAAVAGLGVGLGTLGANAIYGDDRNWSGVARNAGLTDAGSLGGKLSALEAAGIPPQAIAQILRESDSPEMARQWLGTELGRAGFDGATLTDDGQVELEGAAVDVLSAFDDVLREDGDDVGMMIADMADSGATADEVEVAVQFYRDAEAASKEEGAPEFDPAAAVVDARATVDEMNAAVQAEADWFDRAQAYQAQVAEYLAPVTGQMRQQADATYQAQAAMLQGLGLPPQMQAGMLMQADAQRQQQFNTANAYQAQITLLPQQIAQQEYQTQQDSIAAQLMNNAIQTQITGMTAPTIDPSMVNPLASIGG